MSDNDPGLTRAVQRVMLHLGCVNGPDPIDPTAYPNGVCLECAEEGFVSPWREAGCANATLIARVARDDETDIERAHLLARLENHRRHIYKALTNLDECTAVLRKYQEIFG